MRKFTIFLILIFILGLVPVNFSKAENLGNKLKGRILLQVESKGEAWYVNPDNSKRYYLGRPDDAFKVMRELGMGISNKDFTSFKGFAPKRLSGKILLKTEDKGKAYYVNPVDLRMLYLGKPNDAFNIMRENGLGISNNDLNKILNNENNKNINSQDTDQDGLSDYDEAKYGTDPKKPDTDGDGYPDGAEVKKGYNPLGEGKLSKNINLFPVTLNKKTGYIDKTGKIIIEQKFDYGEDFYAGLAYVLMGDKKGFINNTGKLIFELPNKIGKHNFGEFPDGLLAIFTVTNDGWGAENYGFMNKKGVMVIPQQYYDVNDFSDGLAYVCKKNTNEKNNCVYIDPTGKTFLKTNFISSKDFSEGLAAFNKEKDKWGYMDKTGKTVIEPKFVIAKNFSEGLAAVAPSWGEWGFIDKTGKMVIEPRFTSVEDFSEGLAVAQNGLGGKVGFIDKTGKFIIEPKYSHADSFNEGVARVSNFPNDSTKDFFIDKNGKTIISLDSPQGVYYKFDIFNPYRNGLFRIFIYDSNSNDLLGMEYVDKTGKVIWKNQETKKQQFFSDGKDCPATISTKTIKDLSDAVVMVIDNNCQTLAGKFGAQSVFTMDTAGREAVKSSLKKYGIVVDQNFDEQKDTDVWGRICLNDSQEGLICSPTYLIKNSSGDWIISQM